MRARFVAGFAVLVFWVLLLVIVATGDSTLGTGKPPVKVEWVGKARRSEAAERKLVEIYYAACYETAREIWPERNDAWLATRLRPVIDLTIGAEGNGIGGEIDRAHIRLEKWDAYHEMLFAEGVILAAREQAVPTSRVGGLAKTVWHRANAAISVDELKGE